MLEPGGPLLCNRKTRRHSWMLSFCFVFRAKSRLAKLVIRFSFFLFRLVALHAVVGLCLAHADP